MGGIISGLLGIGSAAVSASLNARENYKQRQHQTSERVASQQWQDMQRREQNQFSESMYKRYQSPQAMVNQYRAAGLNPLLAVDGTAAPAVSSGSSGSAPTGGSTSAIPIMAPSTLSGSFQDIAGGLKALAEAKKAGVETSQLEESFKYELEKKRLGAKALELDNYLKGIDVEWKSKEKFQQYQKLLQDIAIGNVSKQQLEKQLEILGLDKKIKGYIEESWWDSYYAELDLWRSEQFNNEASAKLKESQTQTEAYKRGLISAQTGVVRNQEAITSFAASLRSKLNDKFLHDSEYRNNVIGVFEQQAKVGNLIPDATLKGIKAKIELMEKQGDYLELRNYLNIVGTCVDVWSTVQGGVNMNLDEFIDNAFDSSTIHYDAEGHVTGRSSTSSRQGGHRYKR